MAGNPAADRTPRLAFPDGLVCNIQYRREKISNTRQFQAFSFGYGRKVSREGNEDKISATARVPRYLAGTRSSKVLGSVLPVGADNRPNVGV